MKRFNQISFFIIILFLLVSVSHCTSTKQIKEKPPISIKEVYFQKWTAGIQGGGSGIDLTIITNLKTYDHQRLDSVYFRNKAVKLHIIEQGTLTYVGRFKTGINQPKDIVMSGNTKDEYGNQLPKNETKIPFELNDDECVISYIKGYERTYFKISNLIEKPALNYPKAPPKTQ